MRRSHALLLLLVVLIAFALWWLVGGGGMDAPVTPTESNPPTSRAPTAAPPLEPAAEAAAEIARADAPVQPEAAASPGRMLKVRVIFSEGRGPAAGAEVLLLPFEAHKSLVTAEFVQYQQAQYDEKLARWGRVFACDAAGQAEIPMPESGWFPVGARMKHLWGSRNIREEERDSLTEIEIELQPTIRVLVVDESRQPVVGVTVAYRALEGLMGHNLKEATTGTDGIAHLRNWQAEYQSNYGPEHEHVVAIALPFEPTVQAAFDPRSPPAETIVLVLPATGFVEVQVFDVTGQPVEGISVMLQKQMGPEQRKRYSPPRGMIHQSWLGLLQVPTVQGIARFEQVGLGLTLEYGADFERSGVIESESGPGPQRSGETVRFVLRQTSSAPVITGRIVNNEGLPLPGFDFSPNIYAAGEHHPVGRARVKADAEGRFRCPLDLDPADVRPKILMCSQEQPGEVLLLIVDFPAQLSPGLNDLGDLVLGGPLLLSGILLTPAGDPAPTASGSVDTDNWFGTEVRQPYDRIHWEAGPDGRLIIRGNLPSRTYWLEASVPTQSDWRLGRFKFERGAADLELRFQQPPGVRGRVLADPSLDLQQISVILNNEEGGVGTSPSTEDGSFTILVKDPGNYDFELRHFFGGSLLWTRRGLTLAEGGSVDLGDIDLRDLLSTQIQLLDPKGAHVPQAFIGIRDQHGAVSAMPFSSNLPITLQHTREQTTALLDAPGFARVEVPLNGAAQTVRLEPGIGVRITLKGLPPKAEEAAWHLQLSQNASSAKDFASRVDVAFPSGAQSVDLSLPVPGDWRLQLVYHMPIGGSMVIPMAFAGADAVIDLRASASRQDFSFDVETETVARAID